MLEIWNLNISNFIHLASYWNFDKPGFRSGVD